MPSKSIFWRYRETAEMTSKVWPIYVYLKSLSPREAQSKFIKAIGTFWQPIALQEIGRKEKEETRSVTLSCIYQLERQQDYLRERFSITQPQNDPVRLEALNSGVNLSFCLDLKIESNETEAILLNYLKHRKTKYCFETGELVRWALVPYWQPIALSYLEAEPLLISQSAGHCLYLLEKHIQYLRESFGLMDSKTSFSAPQKTEVVSPPENGWHDTTEDDEIIGNIFN